MSWEEVGVSKVPCPCGKGTVQQISYGDDWNRIEHGPVTIDCPECACRYVVECEINRGLEPHDETTSYYLTPVGYPAYSGVSERAMFGDLHHDLSVITFPCYLCERFPLASLRTALSEYEAVRSSARVTGAAAEVRNLHKKMLKSVKSALIISALKDAICIYDRFAGSFDRRLPVRLREKAELAAYTAEKRKSQIELLL